jgi:ketosteroid isomerase-like protein
MCRYPVGKLKESEQERPAEVSKRKEQVGQFFAKLAEMQDAEQFEVRGFVAQGVKVVALGHYRWRVKFTGHSFANDWLHVSRFTMPRFRTFRNIWTPTHGQPHIAVRNPLPAGKAL